MAFPIFSFHGKSRKGKIISLPFAAFCFWEKRHFKELLAEEQGISHLLLEMFKIRGQINLLNMQPEIASQFFNHKWNKPMTGYRIIKPLIKLKLSWNHQALFTLIRSDLKSKLFESKERIISKFQGKTIEEKNSNIINWFMHNQVTDKPKSNPSSNSKQNNGEKG